MDERPHRPSDGVRATDGARSTDGGATDGARPAEGVQVSHALGFDLSGHELDGRYRITRRIGTGGMATVYEARRIGLDRRFAIKILRPELAEAETNVKRFLREARAAAAIEHPNIVTIVDVGEHSRPVYFVMEYLDGVDLRQVIRAQGRQQWPRTRERVLQVVAALAAAHARGIVHRDVKPANCFLVRDDAGNERVKVLDFGIAKVLEESQDFTNVTATHGIVGTVAYMAPEQAKSGTVDARTDVYALGTMIYELLAGTVPFPDKNPFVALSRQMSDPPQPLREHRPDLSAEVEAIVMTCLAKDPAERFQSMEALGGALRAVADEPVVWTGPMVAAPREESPPAEASTGGMPRVHVRAQASAMPVAPPPSGPLAGDPTLAGALPRTEQLPARGGREDATPTFPLRPERAAPVVHGREAAAPMPAALRSSQAVPAVREREASSGADTLHGDPTPADASGSVHPRHGMVGLVVGALGMLALGGTATWWALQRDASAETATTEVPVEPPTPTTTTVPTLVPVPTPIERAAEPTDAAAPRPAVTPTPEPPRTDPPTPTREPARTRPRSTSSEPRTPAPTPAEPTPTAKPPDPPPPDVAPDLRNPFVPPKG